MLRALFLVVFIALLSWQRLSNGQELDACPCKGPSAPGGERFYWQNPLPTGNPLAAVFGTDERNVWAVGERGTILKWDGVSWRVDFSGTTASLYAIWGSGPQSIWAVGEGGTIVN